MDIKIGNDLIAEFMGFQHTNLGLVDQKETLLFEDTDTFTELKFHNDWNWVQAVVQKCFHTEVKDSQLYAEIQDALIERDDRLHKVWVSCLHFIQHK